MPIDTIVNLLVTITLLEMMAAIGLGVTLSQVASVAKDVGLVVRAAVANYLLVPLAALALLLMFRAHPMAAAGFLIAAVCPGAPYGPPFTGMAKGNVAVSVALMVILAGSSALVAPVLLRFLLPLIASEEPLKVNTLKMLTTLFFTQLAPLCAGLAVRERLPALADKLVGPARRLSAALNLAVFGFILYAQWNTLAGIPARGFLGMLLLVLATVVIGWALGGARVRTRRAMTATTAVRNVAVSLVVATGSFPGTAAVTAALSYAVFQTIVLALVVLAWGRMIPIHDESAAAA
jgi:BASS family bile acid:Na+ symporter